MKVKVGDVLHYTNSRIERKSWVVVEIEDWHVTLLDADKMHSEHKGLGDFWRVDKTFLGMSFIKL